VLIRQALLARSSKWVLRVCRQGKKGSRKIIRYISSV